MLQVSPFSQPPPQIGLGLPNLSVPPPHHYQNRFHNERGGHRGHFFQPFRPYPRPGPGGAAADAEFDGKRLRKSVMRKTVDYNSSVIKMLESRVWQRDFRDRRALQPDVLYYPDLQPPHSYVDNPINSVTTRFVKTATNKMRCPIFCMAWTPEGRRLVTGASSGEFTLWNGLTFNFETILQAHDSPVRTMVWSHNDVWMVTGDHAGYVKYWQSNMNNVKMFQAHKEALRGLSFSSTDHKFVTCSDDGTLRIWDFMRCYEERILRGHGADVKCVHWHPQKGLIVSGSKDNQQPVKLWDPKTGQSLATLHAHKSTVMDIKWNRNGNWLVTASRDHLLKLFDVRNLSQEVQTFRGHKKEASSVSWHPCHEGLFASGGSDGAILFWHVGADKEVGGIEQAHDSIVWTLAWHPMGHILCSGSNDHSSKFWTRNRPGDSMTDKYNLNTTPAGLPGIDEFDVDEPAVIPGMGPEDKVELESCQEDATIPGLDIGEPQDDKQKASQKKVPYSKPIPRNFQAQWNETGHSVVDESRDDEEGGGRKDPLSEAISQLMETNPPPGVVPVSELQPQAIIIYGKLLQVEGNPLLQKAIASGAEALSKLIHSGQLEELHDVLPQDELRPAFPMDEDDVSQSNLPASGPDGSADLDMRTIMVPRYPPNMPDQDMRFTAGDVDFRQQLKPPTSMEDQDLRRLHVGPPMSMDKDMRDQGPGHLGYDDRGIRHFADEDLRSGPPRDFGNDVDLRRSHLPMPGPLGPVHAQHMNSPSGSGGMQNSPSNHDVDARTLGDALGAPRKVLLNTPQFRPGPPGVGDQPPWRGSPHEQWSSIQPDLENEDYDHAGARHMLEGPARGRSSYPSRDFSRGGRGQGIMNSRLPFSMDVPGPFGRARGSAPQPPFTQNVNFQAAQFSPGDMKVLGGMYKEENVQVDPYNQYPNAKSDADDEEAGNVYRGNFGLGRPLDVNTEGVEHVPRESMAGRGRHIAEVAAPYAASRQPPVAGFGPPRLPMGDGMRGSYGRGSRMLTVGSIRGRGGLFSADRYGALEGGEGDKVLDEQYGPGRQLDPSFDGRLGHAGRILVGGMRGHGGFRPRRGESGETEDLPGSNYGPARQIAGNFRFGLSGKLGTGINMRGRGGYLAPVGHGRTEVGTTFLEHDDEDLNDEDMDEDPLELAQRIDKDLRDDDDCSSQFEEPIVSKYDLQNKHIPDSIRGSLSSYPQQTRLGSGYDRGKHGLEEMSAPGRHMKQDGDRGYGHGEEADDLEAEEGEMEGTEDEGWSTAPTRHTKDDWPSMRGLGRGSSRVFHRGRGTARGRFRGSRPRRAVNTNTF